jgi:hypothetical protein
VSTFLEQVQAAIDVNKPLSKEDADTAIQAIKDAERSSRFGEALIDRGFCLECGLAMHYPQGKQHRSRGNEWLRKLIDGWHSPATITLDRNSTAAVNGYARETAQLYMCQNCQKELEQRIADLKAEAARERESEQVKYIAGVIAGTIRTTPYKEFSIIAANTSDDDIAALRAMPYRQFLQTRYWQAIRRYVVYRKKVCDLCYSSDNLNVHHKTYARHGLEHFADVVLNDLTLLCRACHAKFHDKLAHPN